MDLTDKSLYINRELSWLEFNERVLDEALERTTPLLERLKFLSITASNMDEFFMVRVSGLKEQQEAGVAGGCPTGMTPARQLEEISAKVHNMTIKQYNCLSRAILPALRKEGIRFLKYSELNAAQRTFIRDYFTTTIFPILTPMAIDQGRPFPLINNKSINLISTLANKENERFFAITQVPTVVPRITPLTGGPDAGIRDFIMLEEIIRKHIGALFPGYKVIGSVAFRVTKNSDLDIDEEDARDLLFEIERGVKRRNWGEPVRIEVEKTMDTESLAFLTRTFKLGAADVYEISGYLDLTVWFSVYGLNGCERLKYPPLAPQPVPEFYGRDIFEVIGERDVLVHHPFESFDCVIDFIKQAAEDENVLAIKQTLYRVSGNSPVVQHLIRAAENGKQVTVLVELKARFDEENNINWARKLEDAGCHVVYGLVGLKTHCKMCLVVRREEDGIRRYVHLGTGNYNDSTAKLYTDLGLFTCRETFGQDSSSLFNLLTGYSTNSRFGKLVAAPGNLRETLIKLIRTEAKNAAAGNEAQIICKMNSLVDAAIIQELYKASIAGAEIRLIVRGICCLRPGIPFVSENIYVTSIVGRFLEHSRIFYFKNSGGNEKVFLSSADWMPRNLDRRVETAFPVESELKERIKVILSTVLSDTAKQWQLNSDGTYERLDKRGKENVNSQLKFHEAAAQEAAKAMEED